MSRGSGDLTHSTAGRGARLGSQGPSFLALQSVTLQCCPEWGGAESPTGMAQGPAAARPGDERGAGRWGLRMQPCLGDRPCPGPGPPTAEWALVVTRGVGRGGQMPPSSQLDTGDWRTQSAPGAGWGGAVPPFPPTQPSPSFHSSPWHLVMDSAVSPLKFTC